MSWHIQHGYPRAIHDGSRIPASCSPPETSRPRASWPSVLHSSGTFPPVMLWFTCPSVPWLISLLSHGSSLVLFRGSFSLFSIVRLAFFSVIRLSFFPWFASLSFPDDSYWLGLVTMHQRSDTTRPVQQLAGERAAWTMEVPQYRPSTSRASFSTIMNSILGIPRLYTCSTSPL
jgi:hypothetical protein